MYLGYSENDKMWNIQTSQRIAYIYLENKIRKNINNQQQNKKGFLSDNMHAH